MIEYDEKTIEYLFLEIEKLPYIAPLNLEHLTELFLWRNMELCIYLDNRIGLNLNPMDISPNAFNEYHKKYMTCYELISNPAKYSWFKNYWICKEGSIVGSFAIQKPMGSYWRYIEVVCLYLMPDYRKKGIVKVLLDDINAIVQKAGAFGIFLRTEWMMQRNVRYYLSRNMWVVSWKRSLGFAHISKLPKYNVTIKDQEASFFLDMDGWKEIAHAKVQNGFLELKEPNLPEELSFADIYVISTLSLYLAIHGFPLKRSKKTWKDRYSWSDIGMPEGLGYNIENWEYWERIHGFHCDSVKIPGLNYKIARKHVCEKRNIWKY
jgi:N-acetylglutamate synthase-like GNAT family acetyltransferase